MSPNTCEELSALDATFLELEEADQGAHMHIGAVMVFESSHGWYPSAAQIAAHLEERLDDLPRFRQRLSATSTGGLHWPSWQEDKRFRTSDHVRSVRLPPPGGTQELLDWAGEFFSERLDRGRPLWEMVVVDGLGDSRWALATKTHHCMVDGVGSVDVAELILDPEPKPGAPSPRRSAGRAMPPRLTVAPSALRSAAGTAARLALVPWHLARAGFGLAGGAAETARHPARAGDALRRSRAMAEVLMRDEIVAAPRTSLNVPIGAKRRLAVTSVPLEELKAIERSLGGTVNDVVLAIAAGGLRRLLLERGEPLPEDGLRAMVPVNLRSAGEQLALGNRITSLYVHLPVGEREPLARYRRQMREAEALKSSTQGLGTSTILDLTQHAPPVIHSFLARSLFATRLFNLTITNVPGTQSTLYAFGSRMTEVWPLVPLAAEHAVGLAALSYDGKMFFAVNADHDAVPDLDALTEGLEASFSELRDDAAAHAGAP